MPSLSPTQYAALLVIAVAYLLVIRKIRQWERTGKLTSDYRTWTESEARRLVAGGAVRTPVPKAAIKEKRVA